MQTLISAEHSKIDKKIIKNIYDLKVYKVETQKTA